MLGSAASSKRQIAPGRVRGRRGRDSLPLLPHSPSTTNEDLLCACSERSTRARLQGRSAARSREGMGSGIDSGGEALCVSRWAADWGEGSS